MSFVGPIRRGPGAHWGSLAASARQRRSNPPSSDFPSETILARRASKISVPPKSSAQPGWNATRVPTRYQKTTGSVSGGPHLEQSSGGVPRKRRSGDSGSPKQATLTPRFRRYAPRPLAWRWALAVRLRCSCCLIIERAPLPARGGVLDLGAVAQFDRASYGPLSRLVAVALRRYWALLCPPSASTSISAQRLSFAMCS